MSAVGQQALWSADHVVTSDNVKIRHKSAMKLKNKELQHDQIIIWFAVSFFLG